MATSKIVCNKCSSVIEYKVKELQKNRTRTVHCEKCGIVNEAEVKAVARFTRTAPRKLRLVADLVRGKGVEEALRLLKFTDKRAARTMMKVLNSAISNAEDLFHLTPDSLYVSQIFVDQGPTLKRWMPRAMGRASMIRKRSSHITVKLEEIKEKVKEKRGQKVGTKG